MSFHRFAVLIQRIAAEKDVSRVQEYLLAFFRDVVDRDAVISLNLLLGKSIPTTVSLSTLRSWAREEAGVPEWMFEECVEATGRADVAIALAPPCETSGEYPLGEVFALVQNLKSETQEMRKRIVTSTWRQLQYEDRMLFNHLLMGRRCARVDVGGLSAALSRVLSTPAGIVAGILQSGGDILSHRSLESLFDVHPEVRAQWKAYPFCPLPPAGRDIPSNLDIRSLAFDLLKSRDRVQLIRKFGRTLIWSAQNKWADVGEMHLAVDLNHLPDHTTMEGELVGDMFHPSDLLECKGEDVLHQPLSYRLDRLRELLSSIPGRGIELNEVRPESMEEIEEVIASGRRRGYDSVLVRRLQSHYGADETMLLKTSLHVLHAVLVYVHTDMNGRRVHSFGLPDAGRWTTVARITESKSIPELDLFVESNTTSRSGPVSMVRPSLVCRIEFEQALPSARSRSGLRLVAPEIRAVLGRVGDFKPDAMGDLKATTSNQAHLSGESRILPRRPAFAESPPS